MDDAKTDLLVLEVQAGNARAFELLFRQFNPRLIRFAYRFSGDEQLARDSVQETWITLSKKLSALKDPRSFKVWAYKTVRWRITDLIRRRGETLSSFDEQSDCYINPDDHSADVTPSQLRAHINQLSAEDRHTITLFYLGELRLVEIAVVLDIPIGTVKSRLNRARAQLRNQMLGEEE